jgi:hypothetical protein
VGERTRFRFAFVANNQLTTEVDVVKIVDRSELASSLCAIDTDVENRS